jgi:predicted ATPase/DNA-binding SARP family transcriptional activator
MEVRLLGPLAVEADGAQASLGGRQRRAVLALLALAEGRVLSVDALVEALWGERPPATAANTVQVHVSALRKALAGLGAESEAIVRDGAGYRLALPSESLDHVRFAELSATGEELLDHGDAEGARSVFVEALALWRGPALADFEYDPWAQPEASRLEDGRLACLEGRIEAELASGRDSELVGELQMLSSLHPQRERFTAQLMLALYRSGRQAEALEVYQRARERLVEELGIEPDPGLQTLNRQILNQDEALAGPASSGPAQVRLPAAPTPLVGRKQELAELADLLDDDDVRLLTLTGAGGSGKTRLAAQAAADVSELYPDGVFWVGLAALREPALVTATIAQVLGVEQDLAEHIGSQRLLLLLDNLEHLLGAAPELGELLAACPNVTLLVTSREPLHLRREREYAVLPLRERDAVSLFHERVRASGAGVAADRDATEICRRLDHLPLAIELAAARVKVLPPRALLDRLDQRLPLLTGGARDLPARQRTLRATIDWSYDLLDSAEQSLFARLAVFTGGCTLEAAEEVCEADLDTLQSLVEKSLLRHTDGRFWMLETIREFARERLRDLGEERAIARRHASYFLRLAQDAESRMSGPQQATLLQMLEREHDNARGAFDWAVENDVETALALGNALQRLWYLHGYGREGLTRLTAALGRGEKAPSLIRARALRTAGTLAEACSELTHARELLGESITLLRGLPQPKELATSLNNQGAIAAHQGDYEAARRAYEESLDLKRTVEDTLGILMTSSNLAILEGKLGEYETSRRRHEEILPSLREFGSPYALSNCLASLGEIALLRGDRIEGRTMLEQSLELRREVGDKAGILESQALLSRADCADGDRASAELRLREGLQLAQEIDDPGMLIAVLEARADLEAFLGDATRAVALRTAAGRMRSEIGAHFFNADTTWRDRAVAYARRRLLGGECTGACAEGEAASPEDVLAWAQAPVGVPTAAAR